MIYSKWYLARNCYWNLPRSYCKNALFTLLSALLKYPTKFPIENESSLLEVSDKNREFLAVFLVAWFFTVYIMIYSAKQRTLIVGQKQNKFSLPYIYTGYHNQVLFLTRNTLAIFEYVSTVESLQPALIAN